MKTLMRQLLHREVRRSRRIDSWFQKTSIKCSTTLPKKFFATSHQIYSIMVRNISKLCNQILNLIIRTKERQFHHLKTANQSKQIIKSLNQVLACSSLKMECKNKMSVKEQMMKNMVQSSMGTKKLKNIMKRIIDKSK